MDIVVISTSINATPPAYVAWSNVGRLIVAGDVSTPSELEKFIKNLGSQHRYLAPSDQREWASSSVIGWRSIQRRNIAILEAISTGADYIITVDDDNFPLPGIHHIIDAFDANSDVTRIGSSTGWYDPCQHLTRSLWHRGFPYSHRDHHAPRSWSRGQLNTPIGVVAAMWLGEPDIGAIDRIANPVQVYTHDSTVFDIVLDKGTWAPFNSQATAWDVKYASLMMCWPGVGRFDDILASFFARRILDELGVGVKYTRPLVCQKRNDHDPFIDLEKEIFGYRNQDRFCEILRETDLSNDETIEQMQWRLFSALRDARFLPVTAVDAFPRWLNDVMTAEIKRGREQ